MVDEPKLPLPAVLASMRSYWAQKPQPTAIQAYYGVRAIKDANSLLKSSNMNIVWEGLYRRDEYLPEAYCEYFIQQRRMWQALSIVLPAKQRKSAVDAIADSAEELAETIRTHEREISLSIGFPL